jgi:hypothetical protein
VVFHTSDAKLAVVDIIEGVAARVAADVAAGVFETVNKEKESDETMVYQPGDQGKEKRKKEQRK